MRGAFFCARVLTGRVSRRLTLAYASCSEVGVVAERVPVEIVVGPRSGGAVVRVGGVDLANACRGFTLAAGVDEVPRLVLELATGVTRVGCAEAEVLVPVAVRDALLALGWVPPGGAAVVGESESRGVAG